MTLQAKLVRAEERDPNQYEAFLVTSEDTDGRLEWIDGQVPYSQGPIYHIHHGADELFMVLEGEVKVKVAGEFYDVRAGDVLFVPRGIAHTYTNIHQDQPARLVALYTPAGLQEFLSVWEKATVNGLPDEATMAELGARYGQEPCGPPLAVELGLYEAERA